MPKTLVAAMCVLALGLAACGGSGKKAVGELVVTALEHTAIVTKAITDAQNAVRTLDGESTDAEVAAAENAIAAARKALADADTLSGEVKDEFSDQIDSLDKSLEEKKALIARTQEDERRQAAADVGRVFSALERPGISDIRAKVRYGAPPTMSGTVRGIPPVSVSDLETDGAVGSLGVWRGGTFTAATARTADTIALYSNMEAPGSQPFSGEGGKYGAANGLDEDGNLPITADTDATLIASDGFPTGAGIREHEAGTDGLVQVMGSFDGAPGAYVCTASLDGACTSSVKHGGGYALTGGTWKFVPGEDATVRPRDAEFQYFGWWQRKTGDSYAVAAFHAGEGGAQDEFEGLAALQGPATYRGPAVGKFALRPQISEPTAGDFTATATLTVDFGDGAATGTVKGTVDGFTANGVRMPTWSVELGAAGIGSDGAIAGNGIQTAGTVWSIGENPSTRTSTWSGQFHDVGGDRVPATATGRFEASYDGIGRMVGAFGAARQQ